MVVAPNYHLEAFQKLLDIAGKFRKNKVMRPFLSFVLFTTIVGSIVLGFALPAFAVEEVCGACDKKVVVTGQYDHGTSDTFLIANAPGTEVAFRADIHGRNFALTVPNLMAGKYTIEIGLAELECNHAGQRIFDILCGDQVIATNLDIFVAAGRKEKNKGNPAAVGPFDRNTPGAVSHRFL